MNFDILTIFPEAFNSYFNISIIKRAQKKGLIKIKTHGLRDYAFDKHRTVDDRPYGGGPGMVMKIEPIWKALQKLKKSSLSEVSKVKQKIILLTPRGRVFNQKLAEKFSKLDRIILISGHYEGVDERVNKLIDEKISIGDYVLSGGEAPAMVIVDAVARLIPGVLGNKESLKEESFNRSLSKKQQSASVLEYPQYTRPEVFSPAKTLQDKILIGKPSKNKKWKACPPKFREPKVWRVPKILLSGNFKKIQEWRAARRRTKKARH